MRINQLQLYSYRLPLSHPLMIGIAVSEFRDGVLLKITTDDSQTAWGEIAPLEGLGLETLSQASSQICAIRARLMSIELPDSGPNLIDQLDSCLEPFQLHPSVHFGVEMATLNALAQKHCSTPAHLLNPQSTSFIAVNGVMNGSLDQIRIEASQIRNAGFTTVKLKVGRDTVDHDIERVRIVRAELGDTISLRLDANRSWDLDSAITFVREIRNCNIEFVEEPLGDSNLLPELCERSTLSVALDESLVTTSPKMLKTFPGLVALVLKPTVLGGIAKTIQFARRAQQLHLAAIISASVESSVGLAMLANIAASYGSQNRPHGLDTAKWLARDLTQLQLRPVNGRISLAEAAVVSESLDPSALIEIPHG